MSINLVNWRQEFYEKCQLFRVIGIQDSNINATYIKKLPYTCSGYGKPRELCGNCQFIEICDSKVPYICNCTEVQKITSSCEESIRQQNISGIYTIQPKNSPFDVVCQIIEDKVWTLYLQLVKAISIVSDTYSTYENFNGNFVNNFWLGLKSLYDLTNTKDMVLRIEFITVSLKKIILEYTGFEVLDNEKYGLFYKRYRVIQSDTPLEDNLKCRIGQPFILCTAEKQAWWGDCNLNEVPLRINEIKWNLLDETILQMKMFIRKAVLCEDLQGEFKEGTDLTIDGTSIFGHWVNNIQYNGTISDGGNNKCIGVVMFPNQSVNITFEYVENECRMAWSNNNSWNKISCCVNTNKHTTCETIVENQCINGDYYINPDGHGMFKIHCSFSVSEVRSYFFYRYLIDGGENLIGEEITEKDMYNGIYIGNRKLFWIGFKNLYRLLQSVASVRMTVNSDKFVGTWRSDHYYGFEIFNNITYDMGYKSHMVAGIGDPLATMKNRPLIHCRDFIVWWKCALQESKQIPFERTNIYWNGVTYKNMKMYLMTKI